MLVSSCAAPADEPGAPADNSPILVGLQATVSGPSSALGIAARQGVELAVSEINEAGGVNGRQIELIFEDDGGTLEGGAEVARRMADHDVFGVISGGNSLAVQSAIGFMAREGMPYLAVIASDPSVLEAGPTVFMGGTVPQQGIVSAQADFMLNTLGFTTVAQLVCDAGFCEQGADEWAKIDESTNVEILETQSFASGTVDFTAQIQALSQSGADVIRVAALPADAGNFVRQLRQAGVTTPVLGDPAFASQSVIDVAGPAAEGAYTGFLASEQFIDDDSGFMAEWLDRFEAMFPGVVAHQQALLGYADAYVFAEGIRRAGDNLTAESWVEAMESLDGFLAGEDDTWNAVPVGLPRSYSADNRQGNDRVVPLVVESGAWVPVS